MTLWLLFLFVRVTSVPPQTSETLTLGEALGIARAHSPLAAAARAQAEGAEKAAEVAGRMADPHFELKMENWRPGADDFAAGRDLDVFAQPLDLFTRGGRKAQARGESDEAAAARLHAEHDVQIDTVRGYLETWRGRELVTALEAQTDNLSGIVTAMERRVAEGYAAEADLLRFRAEAARAARERRDRRHHDLHALDPHRSSDALRDHRGPRAPAPGGGLT